MPQMAPMWWMSLEIMFLMTNLIMMMSLYFNFKIKMKNTCKYSKKKNIWLW